MTYSVAPKAPGRNDASVTIDRVSVGCGIVMDLLLESASLHFLNKVGFGTPRSSYSLPI